VSANDFWPWDIISPVLAVLVLDGGGENSIGWMCDRVCCWAGLGSGGNEEQLPRTRRLCASGGSGGTIVLSQ